MEDGKKKIFTKIINIKPENIKGILRQSRSLIIIGKKSNYITQLKEIKLNYNNSEIIFNFIDDGIDLDSLINSQVFDYRNQSNLIKWILFQILKGLETIHSLNIIHRHINPKHILISAKGETKICGFSNSINDIESKFVVDKVVGELPYIAPECLLKLNFNNKIDIWSVGILMLELYYKKTMFFKINEEDRKKSDPNKLLFKQLKYLANFFKIPFNFSENNEELIYWLTNNTKFDDKNFKEIFKDNPELDEDCLELLKRLLCFNPKERISAKEALKMPYFHAFQNFNKDEFKKSKSKNNEDLSLFLKNLEKEFPKINDLPQDKKNEVLKKEFYKISQYRPKTISNI